MSSFGLYFVLGREHILDYKHGYDHILFILALNVVYLPKDWKKILVLITAFTIGHSVTLALATLRIISFSAEVIEFLIPLTILCTSIANLFLKESAIDSNRRVQYNYFLAVVFGLIHGMGFSTYLRALLGSHESIITPLLAFNLGLEFGQVVIVAIFMVTTFIFVRWAGVQRRDWKMIVSSAIAGMALILIKNSVFW